MKTFIAENKIKLSKFLLDGFEGELSFSALNKLLRKKDIKVNGKRVNKDVFLSKGDEVVVYYDGANRETHNNILYEDENLLAAVKPKGVTSEDFYENLKKEYKSLYFCHRLDRNTDGVMLFAKTEESYNALLEGFKKRTFDKYYKAAVYGVFEKKSAVLSAFLFKDAKAATVTVTSDRAKGAKPIKTEYKVIKEDKERNISLLEVKLLTGRTHQIRAHFASEGHFVLGDGKYGSEKINRAYSAKKMQLTSYKTVLHFDKASALYYLEGKTFLWENGEFII